MGCCGGKATKPEAAADTGDGRKKKPGSTGKPDRPSPSSPPSPEGPPGTGKLPPIPAEYQSTPDLSEEQRAERGKLRGAFAKGVRGVKPMMEWRDEPGLPLAEKDARKKLREAYKRGKEAAAAQAKAPTDAEGKGDSPAGGRPPPLSTAKSGKPTQPHEESSSRPPPSSLSKGKGSSGTKAGRNSFAKGGPKPTSAPKGSSKPSKPPAGALVKLQGSQGARPPVGSLVKGADPPPEAEAVDEVVEEDVVDEVVDEEVVDEVEEEEDEEEEEDDDDMALSAALLAAAVGADVAGASRVAAAERAAADEKRRQDEEAREARERAMQQRLAELEAKLDAKTSSKQRRRRRRGSSSSSSSTPSASTSSKSDKPGSNSSDSAAMATSRSSTSTSRHRSESSSSASSRSSGDREKVKESKGRKKRESAAKKKSKKDRVKILPKGMKDATAKELREGLGVYTLEQPLPPAGAKYSISNQSQCTCAVVLSFVGSINLRFSIPEDASARGVQYHMVQPPYGAELVGEVPAHDVMTFVEVRPDNEYAPWTISLSSRWQVLAAPPPETLSIYSSRPPSTEPPHYYSSRSPSPVHPPPPRTRTASPSRSPEMEEARVLSDRWDGSGGSWGALQAATSAKVPFVDPDFPPTPLDINGLRAPCDEWMRAEKITRQQLGDSIASSECVMNTGYGAGPWITMALALLLDTNPDCLDALYPALLCSDRTIEKGLKVGAVEQWWCIGGWWEKLIVDSYVPMHSGETALVRAWHIDKRRRRTPLAWGAMIAKGYAKALHGYHRLSAGTVGHFLQDATGCPYKKVPLGTMGSETPEDILDMETLWLDIREHLREGHLVGVTTVASRETAASWRGDCDAEVHHTAVSKSFAALPPDTTLPVLAYRDPPPHTNCRHGELKLRSRWGWSRRAADDEITDKWVPYGEVLKAFASATVCFLTPGWTDTRVRLNLSPDGLLDTAVQVAVSEPTQAHVWLGVAGPPHPKPLQLGILILAPAVGEMVQLGASHQVHTWVGVESSAHVWGEVELQPNPHPYLILPIALEPPASYPERPLLHLAMRFSEPAFGSLTFVPTTQRLVETTELLAVVQEGELKPVVDSSGRSVTIMLLQKYRWLGCAVRNDTDTPCNVTIDFAGSDGYECVRPGHMVERGGSPLLFVIDLPPRATGYVATLGAPGAAWGYSLHAECRWDTRSTAAHGQDLWIDLQNRIPREVQVNGEAQQAEQLVFTSYEAR